MKTLTVRPPWSTLIQLAGKDVENRTWDTKYRGDLAIHAGRNYDRDAHFDPTAANAFLNHPAVRSLNPKYLTHGAIVAVATLTDVHSWATCLKPMSGTLCSEWAQKGQMHWCLENVRPLREPLTWPGSLGLRLLSPETEHLVRERIVQ